MKVDSTIHGDCMSQGIGILATIPGFRVVKKLALRRMMDGDTSKEIHREGTSGILRSHVMGISHGDVALFKKMKLQIIKAGEIAGEIHGVGNRGQIIIMSQERQTSGEIAAVGEHGTMVLGRGKVLTSTYTITKAPGFDRMIIRQVIAGGV